MTTNVKRDIPELLASLGDSGVNSQYLPLSHSICCKLCLSIYNNAKILPCLHSFCLHCLQAYVRKSPDNVKGRKLLCPTCQEYNNLPGNGVKGLLDNTVIENSIASNVPTLSLRKKEEALFPGLYTHSEDSYEVLVKPPHTSSIDHGHCYMNDDDQNENAKWQNFIQRQKSTEIAATIDHHNITSKNSRNISEALKGLSDEERLEKLTNSLKNTFSFSQALQDHELKLENDIRALRSSSCSSSEYSFSQTDYLHEQLTCLQTEAMNIVYRLEGVTTSGDTWERSRARIEQQIHTQADRMINMIRQIERKTLNQIDSYTENNTPLNPVREGKQQLQSLLKNILSVIDFIRLILNYGSSREVDLYEQLVVERCKNILSKVIEVEKTEMTFNSVPVLEEEFDKLLGCLTFTTTTEEIWKVNDIEPGTDNTTQFDSASGDNKHDTTGIPGYHERMLPPSFSREFQQVAMNMTESGYAQSFTPDSLVDDQEQQKLTVDQLIQKFSTEFGMRYNEVMADDSSSNPMTTSLASSENPFPSPIPEESNGNSLDSENFSIHSRFRPRSHKRRHTVSDVQQDLAHARIDLSDNRYRDLIRTRKTSIPETMTRSVGARPLSNDLEQTKRILALCKRQLLEAKSMGIYNRRGDSSPHSLTSPENRVQRSASMSHEHIQRIRTRLGMERPRSPSAGSVHES